MRNSVSAVPKLIAVDMPIGDALVQTIERIWQQGDVVLPLDQRMLPSARRRLALTLAADEMISESGTELLAGVESPNNAMIGPLTPLAVDDALVIATSGSTGQPKGVIHTHATLQAHADRVGERLGLNSSSHWWLCLPPAHIGGFSVIFRARQQQSPLSFASHVDEESIRVARESGASHTAVVPTHLTRHRFDDWACVLVGGAQSGALPSNAIATYGLSETGGGVVYDGRPLRDVEVRLHEGEVLLRSPTLARAYRFGSLDVQSGWLRTGDLGTMVDGLLRIDGRRDDLIITGGNKVWPHVVEQRLREHPLVADVAVRGVSDAEWGSSVCAWVVPKEKNHPPSLDALRSHVKETLAAYCAPQRMAIIDRIPRNSLGKVLAADLPAPVVARQ